MFDWSAFAYGEDWTKMSDVERQRRTAYRLLMDIGQFRNFDTLAEFVADATVAQ